MAGDLTAQHEKLLRMLLILDVFRGEDSTGVAAVAKFNDEVVVAKALGDPFNLFNDGKYERMLRRSNKVFMGHNRYATSGGVSKAGAHPFEFDTLVGAHNGTLNSRFRLDDDKDFKVDSQALYHNIEKNGLKETIRRLGAPGNAWSLTWWDKTDNTLNFLRNAERPMYMCQTADGKVLAWASEMWMLEVAFNRMDIKRGPIVQTEVNQHISFYIDNKGVMAKPKVTAVVPDPVVHLPQQQNNTYKPPHINLTKAGSTGKNDEKKAGTAAVIPFTPTNTPKEVDVSKKAANDISARGLASDPYYLKVTKRRFEILKASKDGNGADYLSLFDPKEPNVDIRLYPHAINKDLLNMEGADIEGNISGWEKTDPLALRPYYKVSPWELKLIPDNLVDPALHFLITEDEEEMTVMDHRGRLITETEFKKTYGICGWCGEHLSILNKNRYTTTGDCLCPDCATNTEVTQYVNII